MLKKIIRKNKESKIISGNTIHGASNPGQIVLSKKRFITLFPELKNFFYLRKINKLYFKEKGGIILKFSRYLYFGDCNPAIVISTDPVYVASYAQDIDCVVLTMYPSNFREIYNLDTGSRLLSINTYGIWKQPQEDILEGVGTTHIWNAFRTLIGEFLSEDEDLINQKKQAIPEYAWKRCEELAFEYPIIMPDTYRSCNPFININPIIVKGVRKNPLHNIG